jgi:hypothetical protein
MFMKLNDKIYKIIYTLFYIVFINFVYLYICLLTEVRIVEYKLFPQWFKEHLVFSVTLRNIDLILHL